MAFSQIIERDLHNLTQVFDCLYHSRTQTALDLMYGIVRMMINTDFVVKYYRVVWHIYCVKERECSRSIVTADIHQGIERTHFLLANLATFFEMWYFGMVRCYQWRDFFLKIQFDREKRSWIPRRYWHWQSSSSRSISQMTISLEMSVVNIFVSNWIWFVFLRMIQIHRFAFMRNLGIIKKVHEFLVSNKQWFF